MAQYNAIIIDDEVNVRQTLEILIQQNCPGIRLCGSAGSAEAGRQLLYKNEVHVIFLDISMPNENGFDFIASIQKENYAIIFTTAYEEYALKAIKTNAIDYLLKPINPQELRESVEKATDYLGLRIQKNDVQKIYSESLENLLHQIKNNGARSDKITVVEKFGFRIVEVNTIRYLEADSNYTKLVLKDGKNLLLSTNLGKLHKQFPKTEFVRISRKHIINKNYLSFMNFCKRYCIVSNSEIERQLEVSIKMRDLKQELS